MAPLTKGLTFAVDDGDGCPVREADSELAAPVPELGDDHGGPEGGQDDADDALHHQQEGGQGTASLDGPSSKPDSGQRLHAEHQSGLEVVDTWETKPVKAKK